MMLTGARFELRIVSFWKVVVCLFMYEDLAELCVQVFVRIGVLDA